MDTKSALRCDFKQKNRDALLTNHDFLIRDLDFQLKMADLIIHQCERLGGAHLEDCAG